MDQEDRFTDKRKEVLDGQGPSALPIEAATVPGPTPDAEASLIGQQQWQAIHQRRAAGASVSAIARDRELDRKTVRSCLAQPAWQPYRREPAAPTMLDAHRAWLAERAPRVHYSARILWQELCGQRGFTCCYEAVKLATLKWVYWFNYHRLLDLIDYISPAEAEANDYRQLAEQAISV